ncbi:uncharacterized protein EV420DRAFT_1511070 [Desarmillaria tabescens]|uniref:Calcium-dependent phosphotriesterase n=1 Tax=Armillaria tabescens TaxID=1929756 RepID=A0AA39NIP6_ARMTA|nr:uncharacterized protein EV420DRAFT_1511070 [Desarmillaria tabescens]KAK0466322.1 hypothetical protein EV420DRAFT_1511070 [Desarmillaria tabescens]
MAGLLATTTVIFVLVLAIFYQVYLSPTLTTFGIGRTVGPYEHNGRCKTILEVEGCEKIVLHHATGNVYMACSTLKQRFHALHPSKEATIPSSETNYFAMYSPDGRITRLSLQNFDMSRTVVFHGMDVVPSSTNTQELFVYLVHHRLPLGFQDPARVGYDSSIEIFKTSVGNTILTHLRTVEHHIIYSPNDVIGSADGKSFFFTNDRGGPKTGLTRDLYEFLRPSSSVGYCHVEEGCKTSISGMLNNNGIVQADNGTIYVSSTLSSGIRVLEKQEDNTLVLTDVIPSETIIDNLSMDETGAVWAAGIPRAQDALKAMMNLFTTPCPVSVYRFSINTGEKVLEDDGSLASFISTAAYDSRRGRLYLHGLGSPGLTVCTI